jgi:hypothetical protein
MRLHQADRVQQVARAPAVKTTSHARVPVRPPLVALQRSIGNRAVGRLVQAKLKIGRPGDRFEREADRVADQVMRMPKAGLQRACACGGDCPRCQAEQPGRELVSLQTKRVHASDTAQLAAPPIVDEVLRSPGQPLDPATRAFMEPRFGYDFSRVRCIPARPPSSRRRA